MNGKNERSKEQFTAYRNLYWGELQPINNCMFYFFSDKSWKPKCSAPLPNCISIQEVLRRQQNNQIDMVANNACQVNKLVKIEVMQGDVLQMDGTIVSQIFEEEATLDMKPYLPDLEQ